MDGNYFKPCLYDDDYNLIAIGKLSEPVQNDPDVELTLVVRIDA